ncbi:putative serine/threonine protein kinase [Tirmania nivea]|nr:putative serine/threonine protein kinase [Tirmania nivea]
MCDYSQPDPLPTNLPFEVFSKTIGRGAYASIKKGKDSNGEVFAVKFIHKQHAMASGNINRRQMDLEIAIHKHCGIHPNIIQYFANGEDAIWRWIAMELAEGGDLFDKIEADAGVSEDIAHFYFTQLISGVTYLHGKNISHRDIKPENMLLDKDGNLKIADFGLAAMFQLRGERKLSTSICGSPPYVAPEVATRSYYSDLVDIWSCGVVLFVMLAGNTPWDEPSDMNWEFVEYKKTKGRTGDELWQKLPTEALSLLRGMMKVDTATRMSLEDVRRHPWFTRRNPLLAENGNCTDRILLATKLMEGLHIDFNRPFSASQEPELQDFERLPCTQPVHVTVGRQLLERDRIGHGISASQPTERRAREFSSTTPVARVQDIRSSLREDPMMSQFAPVPQIPPSLTQVAQRFNDICPPQALTKFYSQLPFQQLLPIISESLHRVGISVPPQEPEVYDDEYYEPVWIKIQTTDSRRCPLSGDVIVDRVSEDMASIEFVKTKGDPLEWRRFFKRVAVLSKDAVYMGDD